VSTAHIEFGIYIPQVSMPYEELLNRALLCEELGIDSFWVYDHLYAPALPERPALEGWTLATGLLMNTSRLRVGHLVLNNNFRHPALLAKMATTLDVMSKGRLEVGIGSGSYAPEHHEGGFAWGSNAERSGRLDEALAIITSMFAQPRTTFSGRHYSVQNLPNLPAPVQSPRPRIHVGGAGPLRTLPLVARYADVWNVPTYALGDWEAKRALLGAACESEGRDPSTLRMSHEAVMVLAQDQAALDEARAKAERRYPGAGWGLHEGGYIGTPPALVDRIARQIERGITLFVFFPSDRGEEDTLRLFADEVLPHFR
jgi:alkanesulfonate monooxygenase SsuD/methylene tetrahydromethanopterin reductase-like flavin-dependent oxidoreductase (luciferase family)